MSEVTDADIDQRIHKIAEWLEVNAPYCAAEHRHLDEGTAERAYWHFGYLCALHDMQAVLRAERAKNEELRAALLNVRSETLEEAARLYESINPASDEERLHDAPGAGAMGAVLEYRDAIRAMKAAAEVHEWMARAALGEKP